MNVAPGAMLPESHVPPSPVDVCAMVSLLVHVTAAPTATVIGFGVKAVVVSVLAPLTIDAAVPAPGAGDGEGVGDGAGDGVGDGVDGEYDDPHPNEIANKSVAIVIRRAGMISP